ncbi:MAG: helix-turn-helix transcriptional regulator [Firmicutes bacterium]|nr:helix-turn-helix transcriptional regulator [Bacillota bacterium]
MALRQKVNILQELKKRGYNTYRIRKENLLAQSTISDLNNDLVRMDARVIDRLCSLIGCQPGDLIEYVPD